MGEYRKTQLKGLDLNDPESMKKHSWISHTRYESGMENKLNGNLDRIHSDPEILKKAVEGRKRAGAYQKAAETNRKNGFFKRFGRAGGLASTGGTVTCNTKFYCERCEKEYTGPKGNNHVTKGTPDCSLDSKKPAELKEMLMTLPETFTMKDLKSRFSEEDVRRIIYLELTKPIEFRSYTKVRNF